jgi:hypothetical protein
MYGRSNAAPHVRTIRIASRLGCPHDDQSVCSLIKTPVILSRPKGGEGSQPIIATKLSALANLLPHHLLNSPSWTPPAP